MSFPRRAASGRRRAIPTNPARWVETEMLFPDAAIPLLITPAVEGIDLCEWAKANSDSVEQHFQECRAILFRGFRITSVERFRAFVTATSDGDFLEYRDRSTPRKLRGSGIYTSTEYPADRHINLHNEGTYWSRWPLRIYFGCITAARRGGATPIADVRRVYRRIPAAIRDRFEEKRIAYVRNFNDGFGLTWQEAFQTEDRAALEDYCRANGIEFEWKPGGRLRTRQTRPAVRLHPDTGETVWFNHGAFFHVAALEPAVRAALVAEVGEDSVPYQTYYGDGSPIEEEFVRVILEAYAAEKVTFPWQTGDVLMLDNMAIAHGREPFEGDRQVLAAMSNGYAP